MRSIHVVLNGGLCNRIRPSLSALFMAHKLGLPIDFRWKVTASCQCGFSSLFESTLTWAPITSKCLRYYNKIKETRILLRQLLISEEDIYISGSEYFEEFHNMYPGEADIWIANEIDNYFIPIKSIKEQIHSISFGRNWQSGIGVHVRRGDKFSRGKGPSCKLFFQEIDKRLKSDTFIYLATDDGINEIDSEIISKFKDRYSSRLLYQRKQRVDRSEMGIQEGLVDLWILRKCATIIGTRVSTYSQTAIIGKQQFRLL